MASHGGTAETMVANATVAASLLKLRLDPSFLGEDMQVRDVMNPSSYEGYMQPCDVMNPSSVGEGTHACNVTGSGGGGAQPGRPHQAGTPSRNAAPSNDSDSDSDNDHDDEWNNKMIGRLERALHDVQTSVNQDAQADRDGTLERVDLRSLESFWHYYNDFEFDDCYDELKEFDDAALDLIGTYVELKDDIDTCCHYVSRDSEVRRLFEHLGAQEVWMTRDFLGSVQQRGDDQIYGAEVLCEFYGEDYW